MDYAEAISIGAAIVVALGGAAFLGAGLRLMIQQVMTED